MLYYLKNLISIVGFGCLLFFIMGHFILIPFLTRKNRKEIIIHSLNSYAMSFDEEVSKFNLALGRINGKYPLFKPLKSNIDASSFLEKSLVFYSPIGGFYEKTIDEYFADQKKNNFFIDSNSLRKLKKIDFKDLRQFSWLSHVGYQFNWFEKLNTFTSWNIESHTIYNSIDLVKPENLSQFPLPKFDYLIGFSKLRLMKGFSEGKYLAAIMDNRVLSSLMFRSKWFDAQLKSLKIIELEKNFINIAKNLNPNFKLEHADNTLLQDVKNVLNGTYKLLNPFYDWKDIEIILSEVESTYVCSSIKNFFIKNSRLIPFLKIRGYTIVDNLIGLFDMRNCGDNYIIQLLNKEIDKKNKEIFLEEDFERLPAINLYTGILPIVVNKLVLKNNKVRALVMDLAILNAFPKFQYEVSED